MNEILELAGQLGKRIAADPRGERMVQAQAALADSEQDRQLLADYETQQRKLHELEAQMKPIEPDDKRKAVDLHARVVASEVLKRLLRAQADFAELMSAVSRRIEQEVMGPPAGK